MLVKRGGSGCKWQESLRTPSRYDQIRISPLCITVKMSTVQGKETTLKAAKEKTKLKGGRAMRMVSDHLFHAFTHKKSGKGTRLNPPLLTLSMLYLFLSFLGSLALNPNRPLALNTHLLLSSLEKPGESTAQQVDAWVSAWVPLATFWLTGNLKNASDWALTSCLWDFDCVPLFILQKTEAGVRWRVSGLSLKWEMPVHRNVINICCLSEFLSIGLTVSVKKIFNDYR